MEPQGRGVCGQAVGAWDELAAGDSRIEYHRREEDFIPDTGDIVLFDRVFCGEEHDHIGVVLEVGDGELVTAEGYRY